MVTKKVKKQRKTISLNPFDNTPKTVKVNGFVAPAILPRPKNSKIHYNDVETRKRIQTKLHNGIVIRV